MKREGFKPSLCVGGGILNLSRLEAGERPEDKHQEEDDDNDDDPPPSENRSRFLEFRHGNTLLSRLLLANYAEKTFLVTAFAGALTLAGDSCPGQKKRAWRPSKDAAERCLFVVLQAF